jgi:Zn-dependent protease
VSNILKNGIPEDIDTVKRISVGKFWGVKLLITPFIWLGPIIFFGLHFLLNLIDVQLSLVERLNQAIFFTIAVEITTLLHAFGHILSGKLVRSPMDELLIASTRDVNVYHGDQSHFPRYVHLVRSLGGPLFNILVAGICYAFAPMVTHVFWSNLLAVLISTNLFFGIGSFLPIQSVDGEVIWREILQH